VVVVVVGGYLRENIQQNITPIPDDTYLHLKLCALDSIAWHAYIMSC
jgi:hypothetical protein